jgi:hypothetical protein
MSMINIYEKHLCRCLVIHSTLALTSTQHPK